MKQMSEVHDSATVRTPVRDGMRVESVATISDAALDKVSGGGGKAGGVVGSRARNN